MILKYSDLKGRTDLVGRKIYFYSGLNHAWVLDYLSEKFAHFTRADGKDVWGRKFYEGKDDDEIELLDEEPATPAKCEGKPGQVWACIDGRAQWIDQPLQDTRTEIAWDNCTLEDQVEMISLVDGKPYSMSLRDHLKEEHPNMYFVQPKIKMTLSQIEEKLGYRVEIVE